MPLTHYLADELLDHAFRNVAYTSPASVHLALFTAIPDQSGGGTEVVGGSYARQQVTSGAAALGVLTNSSAISFPGMPACVVVGAGVFDASVAGNLLVYSPFAVAVTVAVGSTFNVPTADVVTVMR